TGAMWEAVRNSMIPLKPADKFARLHADLRERGAARPFDGALNVWTYAALAETDRAAREVLARLVTTSPRPR
ncbi:MAG: ELM1/GtrOC1 family putative glycosyltransferase, partial [Caulobacter sp.]